MQLKHSCFCGPVCFEVKYIGFYTLVWIISLFSLSNDFTTGYWRDDEHCFEWTPRTGETEYSKARPRRGSGYLRTNEKLSHPSHFHRISQPFAQCCPQELRASDSPKHEFLQWYNEYFQTYGGAQDGRAAKASSLEAETCCSSKNKPYHRTCTPLPGSNRQVLHNVKSTEQGHAGRWLKKNGLVTKVHNP